MAILTNKPSTIAPGVTSSAITLNPTTLISQMNIVDAYYSDSGNWKYVVFSYNDGTNSQFKTLQFNIPTLTGTFEVSDTARENTWVVNNITIRDFDGGSYTIPRASFTSASEFDISVTTPPAGYRYYKVLFANSLVLLGELGLKWSGTNHTLESYTFTTTGGPLSPNNLHDAVLPVDESAVYGPGGASGVAAPWTATIDLTTQRDVTDLLLSPWGVQNAIAHYLPLNFSIEGSNDNSIFTPLQSFVNTDGTSYTPTGAPNEWNPGQFKAYTI